MTLTRTRYVVYDNSSVIFSLQERKSKSSFPQICLGHYPARRISSFFRRTADEMNDKEKAGTLPYMAPEAIRWKAYGRSMDWWSMGITLYKLLIGRVPFHGSSTAKLRQAICVNDVVFPEFKRARAQRVRPAIDIVRQLLKKRPTERLGSGAHGYEVIDS